jgi:hypothetical protein
MEDGQWCVGKQLLQIWSTWDILFQLNARWQWTHVTHTPHCSRCYGCTAVLRLIVQPCHEDDKFFPPMPWSTIGMKLTGENLSSWGKTCPSAILCTTNPTWTDPGLNLGLCGESPATNRLSHGMSRILLLHSTVISEGSNMDIANTGPKFLCCENQQVVWLTGQSAFIATVIMWRKRAVVWWVEWRCFSVYGYEYCSEVQVQTHKLTWNKMNARLSGL